MATPYTPGVRAAAARRGLTTDEYLAKIDAGLKWCRACQAWRPLTSYKPSTSTSDGVRPLCTLHYTPRKPKPITHGHSGYRAGCRCPECRTGHARYQARIRAERRADPQRADRAGHGKRTTYNNHGCRCDACRAAQSQYLRTQRAARRQRQQGAAA